VKRIVNKTGAVFVFDEIDKAEELDFLYFVLEEIYKKCVFLITNYKSWLVELDERIKSRLTPELLEFKQYTEIETRGIIKERADYAFYPNVWEQTALETVVKKTFELKDIRSGLFLLKESSLLAEENSSKKITQDYINGAVKKLDDFTIKNSALLEEDTKIIYQLVKENSGKKIGDLFKIYQKEGGSASYKTFQRNITKLEEGKFIQTKKQTGVGGNTTIVEKKLSEF
jgi:Cdc6-like AAA superfamily ATPase